MINAPYGAKPMKTMVALVILIAATLVLVACGGGRSLDAEERARAAAELYPLVERAHGLVVSEAHGETQARLDALAVRLRDGGVDLPDPLEVVITSEPDPDALCLAGGRIAIGRGLLAWLASDDEAAAVLAAASTMCATADATWRRGSAVGLPDDAPIDPASNDPASNNPASTEAGPAGLRLNRFIDLRLAANSVLYRQLVADACDGDCARRVPGMLDRAGFDRDAYARLVERLQAHRPEALWLERVGASPVDGVASDAAPVGDWAGLADRREGFEYLATIRRELGYGRLDRAYLAVLAARRAMRDDVAGRRLQVELDLRNNHAFYSRDLLDALQAEGHRLPDADFHRGWILAHLKDYDAADALLTPEMEAFPRVSGLYELAVLRVRDRREEEAEALLERARAAGPTSPYRRPIDALALIIERRRR